MAKIGNWEGEWEHKSGGTVLGTKEKLEGTDEWKRKKKA